MTSNYNNNLYKDYEKTQMKLDNVLSELSIIRQEHKKEIKSITKNFKSEISSLNDTIKDLNNTISKLREDNKKLLDEIDRLKK